MNSLGDVAKLFLNAAGGAYREALHPVLDEIGLKVKEEVQKEIGEYQSSIGGYPATAALADATIERKMRDGLGKGGVADTPLWAEGDFHDDINFQSDVGTLSVEIGTNAKSALYTELGTKDMPPRPVFGPAVLRAVPPLLPAIAEAAAMGIAGGIWKGFGAEGITHTKSGDGANVLP